MDQKTKELWVIPAIVGIVTATVVSFVFIYITAWVMGLPLMHKFSFEWIFAALQARVPVWTVLLVVVALAGFFTLFLSQRVKTKIAEKLAKSAKTELDEAVAHRETQTRTNLDIINTRQREISATPILTAPPAPRLVAVWGSDSCKWGPDFLNGRPAIYVRGSGHISLANMPAGTRGINLVQASVNGNPPIDCGPFIIPNGTATLLDLFIVTEPVIGEANEPLVVQITFIDDRGNRYQLPEQTFQWVEPPQAFVHPRIAPRFSTNPLPPR